MKFYAHSTEQQNKSDWQGLSEHLTSVGDLAEEFAAHFGAQKMARTAGLLHDLGNAWRVVRV